ncbi:hypothetical protein [Sphingomonas sp. YL-JM2C]
MKKEDTTQLIDDLSEAEMIDLGVSSELTEGGQGQPGEQLTSSDGAIGF